MTPQQHQLSRELAKHYGSRQRAVLSQPLPSGKHRKQGKGWCVFGGDLLLKMLSHPFWVWSVSGLMGDVVRGRFPFCAPIVRSLLGSKSSLYCGVQGHRAVLWSSCVMTMQLSCHLSLIGLAQSMSSTKLSDPPILFLFPSLPLPSYVIFLCYFKLRWQR